MRLFLTTITILSATAAAADPGHLAARAGHSHLVAAAALGLAATLGIWQAVKGRRKAGQAAKETA